MPLHMENVAGVRFGESDLDYMCINLPPLCNYRCEKCFTWANEHKIENFIGAEKIKEIITEGKKHGVKVLGILGEGETLMFPETLEIISHAHKLGIISLIATNGSFLNEKTTDFLYENGATVVVSLDTLDEKEYKSFCRGNADIKVVKKNISYARKKFKKAIFEKNGHKVYRFAIHMTTTAKNYWNLEKINNFCGEEVYFSCEHIAKIGCANDNPDVYGGKEKKDEYLKVVKKTREIMNPMVLTSTKCGKDTCCFYNYGISLGYEGDIMLDTHAIESKGVIGNIENEPLENLIKKSKQIKDSYYKDHGGHYCIIRDSKYQNFIDFLRGRRTKKISKSRC
jgi:MoaA/NifB/PqqE/SkfB family radical SAM enzyme